MSRKLKKIHGARKSTKEIEKSKGDTEEQERQRNINNERRGIVVDNVVNHGMSMREAAF